MTPESIRLQSNDRRSYSLPGVRDGVKNVFDLHDPSANNDAMRFSVHMPNQSVCGSSQHAIANKVLYTIAINFGDGKRLDQFSLDSHFPTPHCFYPARLLATSDRLCNLNVSSTHTGLARECNALARSYARKSPLGSVPFCGTYKSRVENDSNPSERRCARVATRRFASPCRRAGQQPAFQRLFQSPSSSPHREGRQQQCDQSNRASSLAPSLGDACEMKGLINFALGENEPGVIVRHRGRLI